MTLESFLQFFSSDEKLLGNSIISASTSKYELMHYLTCGFFDDISLKKKLKNFEWGEFMTIAFISSLQLEKIILFELLSSRNKQSPFKRL